MNIRKHEEFDEPTLPKWWSLIIALAFVSVILMASYKVMHDAKPAPRDESHHHISNPEIFNE